VAVLMNAGIDNGGGPFEHYERWRVLAVNLRDQRPTPSPRRLWRTRRLRSSIPPKQGITRLPGDTAYKAQGRREGATGGPRALLAASTAAGDGAPVDPRPRSGTTMGRKRTSRQATRQGA
jgi:hypothetical protein